jgi:dihydrofolate reductase
VSRFPSCPEGLFTQVREVEAFSAVGAGCIHPVSQYHRRQPDERRSYEEGSRGGVRVVGRGEESPDKWHFPYFNEEMGQAVGEGFAAADAMLMGRVNYEEWAAYWPGQDPQENPMAAQMNAIKKYVVSTTLEEPLEWQNSTLIGEDVADEIANLKQGEGEDIVISGSGTLVRSLLRHGLLDELKLMIHPILVGSGKRLFEEREEQTKLELVDSRTFSTGVLYLTYRPT